LTTGITALNMPIFKLSTVVIEIHQILPAAIEILTIFPKHPDPAAYRGGARKGEGRKGKGTKGFLNFYPQKKRRERRGEGKEGRGGERSVRGSKGARGNLASQS